MSIVVADISVSMDGFITGPDDRPGQGLGEGGEVLHYWVFGRPWTYADHTYDDQPTGVDKQVLDEAFAGAGASIVGRGMFDAAGGWGHTNPFPYPVFVLTNRPDEMPETTGFTVVAGGIESALEQARAVAGGKKVGIGGGANVIQQYLAAGLVDELHLHVAPVLLGAGKPLFEGIGRVGLERTGVLESPFATHLRFRVIK